MHDLRLARRHVRGARQLRLRLRAGAARLPRALDADDDAHRSDSVRVDGSGHAVGMGDDSAVSRQPRSHAEGRERDSVHADRVVDDLRHGARSGEDASGDGCRAQRDAAAAARRHGSGLVRLLDPAARAELGAGRLRRLADGDGHDGRRRHPRARRSAARTRRRFHPDHAGHRQHQGRPRVPRKTRRHREPADSAQRDRAGARRRGNPSPADALDRRLSSTRPADLRAVRHRPCRLCVHARRLESVRRIARVARSHHRHAR